MVHVSINLTENQGYTFLQDSVFNIARFKPIRNDSFSTHDKR